MKWILCTLLFLAPALAFGEEPFDTEVNNFDGGVDTNHLSDKLRTSNISNAFNYHSDRKFGLTRRNGHTLEITTTTFGTANSWKYTGPSGTEYFIRLSSNGVLMAGNQIKFGDRLFSVKIATLSTSVRSDAAEGLGKFWFTNKVEGLGSWDETTYVKYLNAPLAARVVIYKNRVVLGDISNKQSSVDLSGELNGGDWNNDSRFSTSPLSIPVGGVNDGTKVHEIHVGMDELIIFKALSMSRLIGNDQRDFRLLTISPEIGTIYPRSVSQRAERTIFLSNRGLDSYTPPFTFEKIGENIQNQLDALASLTARGRLYTFDTQAQWQLGTSSPTGNISTTLSTGSITPTNITHQDTDSVGWSRGSIAAGQGATISSTAISGYLTYMTTVNYSSIINGNFETGALGSGAVGWSSFTSVGMNDPTLTGWVYQINAGVLCTADTTDCFTFAQLLNSVSCGITDFTAFVMNSSSQVLASTALTPAHTTGSSHIFEDFSLDTTLVRGTTVFFGVRATAPDTITFGVVRSTLYTTTPIYASTSITVKAAYNESQVGPPCAHNVSLDLVRQGDQINNGDRMASFRSRLFDTQVSSPNFDPFLATPSSRTAVTFRIEASTDPVCCFDAPVDVATGTLPTSLSKRYFVYVASFAVTVPSFTVVIDSITLGSWATGYYQTSTIDVGSNITSWGLFTTDQALAGGGIGYRVQSSSNPVFNETDWKVQTLNSVIVAPVNRFITVRSTFVAAASTFNPTINSITLNWNEGENPPDPIGLTSKENYLLFYATSVTSGQNNDKMVIYNRNNALDPILNPFPVGGAAVFANTVMAGDANGTGKVYSLFTSTSGSDDNTNVPSYFTLRRIDGGRPDAIKEFDVIYLTISRENTDTSQIFSLTYTLDGGTTIYSAANVEISTGTSLAVLKSFFPLESQRIGNYIDLTISENSTRQYPYNVHRVKVYGKIQELKN